MLICRAERCSAGGCGERDKRVRRDHAPFGHGIAGRVAFGRGGETSQRSNRRDRCRDQDSSCFHVSSFSPRWAQYDFPHLVLFVCRIRSRGGSYVLLSMFVVEASGFVAEVDSTPGRFMSLESINPQALIRTPSRPARRAEGRAGT